MKRLEPGIMYEEIRAWDPTLETRVEHAEAALGRIKEVGLRPQTSRLSLRAQNEP